MKHKKLYMGATLGVVLGVAAVTPVLPLTGQVANVYATEGTSTEVATYADFYDHQHMNRYGAAKFSAYLNDFI